MALFDKLLGKNKKKELKAKCPITKENIEHGFGYMLTTAQIVSSRKFWDMVMTEPETLSYTVSHFKNQQSGTQMRSLIFEKHSSVDKAWMISDSCINLFDVDKAEARADARRWWESEGLYTPSEAGKAEEKMDSSIFKALKEYAVLEAGRSRVAAAL
ncbi:MAG TPA: hypothetical protein PK325_08980 [Cyclobacteriaceae bacterium]|nr:hypothetical protein [Cyclobacteriaceae bacterium]HMV08826.1 hypothetical protein [Cyclobacteriaceae bacterium]HMV90760.1 hypothetical protein [Cyclobacteriaceae bacterium]HMW99972.1 hypothetical protein [Cyclobacteriaceae bacterium]HMX49165.1 hypothetical protein [Cyclobacteriaceae bacterium]